MFAKSLPSTQSCVIPTPTSTFLPTDSRAWLWFDVDGAQAGDFADVEWYDPARRLYDWLDWDPLDAPGHWCFWDYLDIAGKPLASTPGNWSVKVYWNDDLLFTLTFTIVTPNSFEPSLTQSLSPGFYILEATLAPGASPGFWGLEVITSLGQASGGFNLGGGLFPRATSPGFGAFLLSTAQRVTATVNAQLPAGALLTIRFLDSNKNPIGSPVTGLPPLTLGQSLSLGFYIVEVYSSANVAVTYQLGLAADFFSGGVNTGGYLGPGIVGFGAFYVPEAQNVKIRFYGRTTYGAAGAGDMVLALKDANRNVLQVVQPPVAQANYTLTVRKTGNGVGTVTSNPTGINCGTSCAAKFPSGSSVTLTAAPATSATSSVSAFSGWSDACSGTQSTCIVKLDADKIATANFILTAPFVPLTFAAPAILPPAPVGQFYSYPFCQPPPGICQPGVLPTGICGAFPSHGPNDNPTGGAPPYHFELGSGVGFPPFGVFLNLNGMLCGTPTAEGPRDFSVCAVDSDGTSICRTVRLTVNPPQTGGGTGTQPAVTLSATCLDLRTDTVGRPSDPKRVTLTNSGNAPLSITGITLGGASPQDFRLNHNCPLGANNTLAAGGSCTIEVSFAPSIGGCDESARVTIVDNAPQSPQVIELIGRRPAPVGSLCIPAVGCAAPVP